MRKRAALLAVAGLAAIAGLVTASPAHAGHVNTPCDFSQSRDPRFPNGFGYKFAGRNHWDNGNPAFTTEGGLVMSSRYWSFTGAGDGDVFAYNYSNYEGTDFMEVGLNAGYDPWGNKLSQNYPLGTWTDFVHPNDGHDTTHGTTYTPVSWGLVRFAEVYHASPASYQFQAISDNFPISAGQTISLRRDSTGVFSMIDQDSHTLGIANHVSIPVGPANVRILGLFQEDISGDGYCDAGIMQTAQFSDPNGTFWAGYMGCSANGWGGDHLNDPSCRGGAAGQNAPFDVWQNYSCGCFQHQMYEQEAETFGPPFAPVSDPTTLPPSSQNVDGSVPGTAPVVSHAAPIGVLPPSAPRRLAGPKDFNPGFTPPSR